MEELAQQTLLEPAPTRRLQVPVGHASHWGVDPSTRGISVAAAKTRPGEPVTVATRLFAKIQGPARLSHIRAETADFVTGLLKASWTPPGIVYIEQPSGSNPNLELVFAVGVINLAVYDALAEATGRVPIIESVTSAHWKKIACGRGNIYKPKKIKESYGVLDWARLNGYAGTSWDEADALAMAECARREVLLAPR